LSIDVQKSKSRESNIATYHFLQAVKSLSRHDWRVEATRVAASGLQCSFAETSRRSRSRSRSRKISQRLAAALSLDSSRSSVRFSIKLSKRIHCSPSTTIPISYGKAFELLLSSRRNTLSLIVRIVRCSTRLDS
jgi:hypothetical protein